MVELVRGLCFEKHSSGQWEASCCIHLDTPPHFLQCTAFLVVTGAPYDLGVLISGLKLEVSLPDTLPWGNNNGKQLRSSDRAWL